MATSLRIILGIINVSDKSRQENHNTHFTFHNAPTPTPESNAVYQIMWKKYGTARQTTDDNTAHALCMLAN